MSMQEGEICIQVTDPTAERVVIETASQGFVHTTAMRCVVRQERGAKDISAPARIEGKRKKGEWPQEGDPLRVCPFTFPGISDALTAEQKGVVCPIFLSKDQAAKKIRHDSHW